MVKWLRDEKDVGIEDWKVEEEGNILVLRNEVEGIELVGQLKK